jgi:hypothetical protein
MTASHFRHLYSAARENGYSGTRTEFCVLLLGTRGLATKSAIDGAVAWLQVTNADTTHVRRTPRGTP